MWQLLTPFRKRVDARHTPARRPRRYRPHCKFLEDRCLLSVSLTSGGTPFTLVGSPVTWTATTERRRGNTRLPVQRRTGRRYVPDGSRLQLQQQLHMEPHAAGYL